jgi:ribosomal protein S18 acetylase RimI-like enzyme
MKIHYESVDVLDLYAKHLKNLTPEDRYTRFCYQIKDEAIDQLILSMLYRRSDHYLFSASIDNEIVGFVHMARDGADWELAVSVEHQYQGRGIADELMSHMIAWGKVHAVHVVFMHCITDNQKIQHLARKHGLKTLSREGHEITAQVELPRATALDYTASFVTEQQELAKDIVRLQRTWLKNWIHPAHDNSN